MRVLTLIILLLFFSCKTEEKETMRLSDFQKQIDSLFNSAINDNGPGAGVLISLDDSILFSKGYGLRDLTTKEPITTSTNFRIGSVSKQFTALAILSLIEKGDLNLNDSIYNFYPFKSLEGVTIKQMLTHTSGIVDAAAEYWNKWTLNRPVTNDDIIDWYRIHDRKEFFPGEKFEYNNAAYILLASLVEKISGQEFSEYINQNVLEKAGMETSLFYNLSTTTLIPERAYRYEKDSLGVWQNVEGHFLDAVVGDGGLYTNLNDFMKYSSTLREHRILTTEIDSLLFQPVVKVNGLAARDFYIMKKSGSYYGMGWEINETMAVHGGEIFGGHSFVIYEFNRPLTIAIFMNSNSLFRTEPNLLDETYKLTDNYLKTTANNGYK
ncbi:serine hydrolase [Mangrovivirga sp. M17]|uniref:Serine hydrolase n=1 Tax=Mangrovivirga halotolerans TaxID=2993936 RepID=A0ABT3RV37_9BACT|nr:serine hydrolase domain-containing protein [Mangrovivirga halotolerans]MCX2745631.1 serine hydrolase [Mangrovivirga halotolerans]